MQNYTIFRKDRKIGTRKGGVITYIRNDLVEEAVELASYSRNNCEHQIIHLARRNLIIVNLYRPPATNLEHFRNQITAINEEIDKIGSPLPTIIAMGDFNFPTINWARNELTRLRSAAPLMDLMEKYALENYIDAPTRDNNILDLFLTNDAEMVKHVEVMKNERIMSDHNIAIITTGINLHDRPNNRSIIENRLQKLNFLSDRIDWNLIETDLVATNWTETLTNMNCKQSYNIITNIMTQICEKFIQPKRKQGPYRRIPRDRKILLRKGKRYRRQLRQPHNSQQIQVLNRKLSQLNGAIQLSHEKEAKNKEKQAIRKIKENPKYFWCYANNKSKLKTRIGPFIKNGNLITDAIEKCNLLKDHFDSVYSVPKYSKEENERFVIENYETGELRDIDFNEEDLRQAMSELRPTSSSGPDGIHAKLLNKCKDVLKKPLKIIWRKSMDEGTIPEDMKHGNINPAYKNTEESQKSIVGCHRPITLTSHCIKVFGKVVHSYIDSYARSKCLYNKNQHGFRKGRSCLSQLLDHHSQIVHQLCNNEAVDVIYLDFAKAFDKVDHGVLLRKLVKLGIGGKLLRWIHCFITNRTQSVLVDGKESSISEVKSGVPQGTVLGPLLFLIYIADIDDDLQYTKTASFADDTRILKGVKQISDCEQLQEDLNKVYDWARINNMHFNEAKFELLQYGKQNYSFPSFKYNTATGIEIKENSTVKDLGITIQDNAKFDTQLNNIVIKCRRIAGYILRTFKTREQNVMIHLFKMLILPIAEYCSQLWSPTYEGDILKIENIQRSFTKRISGMEDKNYVQRLSELSLYSLQRRRERYQIIYIWKILNNLVPNFSNPAFEVKMTSSERYEIRNGMLCTIPRSPISQKELYERSFIVRGPKLFNKIPREIREFQGNLATFKDKLDNFLSTIADEPNLPYTNSRNGLLDRL